jgi:hypothetical protein
LRLFLDLHVSGPALGRPLRADGHDVVVGADDPLCQGMPDSDLLRKAATANRLMVTFDTGYARLARAWADEGTDHAGVILIVGMRQNEYGAVLRSLRSTLGARPEQQQWRNLLIHVPRSSA